MIPISVRGTLTFYRMFVSHTSSIENDSMDIAAWLAHASADADARGLPELKPLLETLARSTQALRDADAQFEHPAAEHGRGTRATEHAEHEPRNTRNTRSSNADDDETAE